MRVGDVVTVYDISGWRDGVIKKLQVTVEKVYDHGVSYTATTARGRAVSVNSIGSFAFSTFEEARRKVLHLLRCERTVVQTSLSRLEGAMVRLVHLPQEDQT